MINLLKYPVTTTTVGLPPTKLTRDNYNHRRIVFQTITYLQQPQTCYLLYCFIFIKYKHNHNYMFCYFLPNLYNLIHLIFPRFTNNLFFSSNINFCSYTIHIYIKHIFYNYTSNFRNLALPYANQTNCTKAFFRPACQG